MTCNIMSNDSSSSAGGGSDSFCWSLIFFFFFSEKDCNCIHVVGQSIRTATIATEIWSLLFDCSNRLVMIWSKLIY